MMHDDAKSYQSSKYTIYTKYNYQYILTGDHTIFLIKKKIFILIHICLYIYLFIT